MLKHSVVGPYQGGSYLVVYPVPGCGVMAPVCECRTAEQALSEAERMDNAQVLRETAVRWERELRGLGGVYPALESAAA